VVSRALDACGRKLDGSAAAPEYYRRRRRAFYTALKYAVRERHLSANPLDGAEARKCPERWTGAGLPVRPRWRN